jgi:hypothetical protein
MRLHSTRLTPDPMKIVVSGATALVVVMVGEALVNVAHAGEPEKITLLSMLSEWKYPGSRMAGGASMSDGGNPLVQSIKCRALLATSDSVEKVVAFYTKKVQSTRAAKQRDSLGEVKAGDGASVSIQDDSAGRPLSVHIIVVNKVDTSTTLVISRAKDEKETHIAWLHYRRLDAPSEHGKR